MIAIAAGLLVFIIAYLIFLSTTGGSEEAVTSDSNDPSVFSETSPLEYALRWMSENPDAFGPIPNKFLEEKDLSIKCQVYFEHFEKGLKKHLPKVNSLLSHEDKFSLAKILTFDMFGYGPIHELIADVSISEIHVDGPYKVYFFRDGERIESIVKFHNEKHLRTIAERLLNIEGKDLSLNFPKQSVTIPEGFLVEVSLTSDGARNVSLRFVRNAQNC